MNRTEPPLPRPAVTRFWWIRHATVDGPRGCIHGPDAPIVPPDPRSLAALKRLLPDRGVWISSPTRRALDTQRALSHSRPIRLPDLAEQDFGGWTGRFHADLEAENPQAYAAFWQDAAGSAPPDGESFTDQCRRTATCIAGLLTEHAGMDLLLTAHSGTIRAALALALAGDRPPETMAAAALSFVVDPLSLTLLEATGGGWRITCVNRLPTAPAAA